MQPEGRSGDTTPKPADIRSVDEFLALVVALSVPPWVLGSVTKRQLASGLPLSALMAGAPLTAAAWLTYRRAGAAGLRGLLRRCISVQEMPPAWYLVALLLNPAIALAVYGLLRARGVPLPPFRASPRDALALAVVFVLAAIAEEAGWSGYALDPLIARWGRLRAGLLLGAIWAAWHLIPYQQAGRSRGWIAWQSLKTVASRVLLVWLYTRTKRSVLATVLFHASDNLSAFLFPQAGSHYDPKLTALFLSGIAAVLERQP